MRGLDLFSGIGGASLAMQAANIEVAAHSEIEPFPCRVLDYRFPGVPNLGDVSKITPEALDALGDIDIVSFGSPCQDWSVAGKRLGLKGHRSSLFHEAIRIIRHVRPRYAVFENVPGLFSAAGGWDFAAVLDEMADAGALDLAWSVLDAQWFGVPQRRRRIFLVADFGGERAGEILSISEGVFGDSAPSGEAGQEAPRSSGDGAPIAGTLTGNGDAHSGFKDTEGIVGVTNRGFESGSVAETLRSASHGALPMVAFTLGGGSGARGWADDTDRMTFIPEVARCQPGNGRWDGETETFIPVAEPIPFDTTQITSDKNYSRPKAGDPCHPLAAGAHPAAVAVRTAQTGANGIGVASDAAHTLDESNGQAVAFHCMQDPIHGDISPALSRGNQQGISTTAVQQGMAVRRLTPLEAERLQGFPDGWTDIPGASDSARYRALGNAWAVPCGAWVMRSIAEVDRVKEET